MTDLRRRLRSAPRTSHWEEYAASGYFLPVDEAGERVLAELAARVATAPAAPAVGPPATYLEHADDAVVRWARGSRAFTDFRAVARVAHVAPRPGRPERAGVLLTYADVVVVAGVVAEFGAMRLLHDQVGQVVRERRPDLEEQVLDARALRALAAGD